LSQTGIKLSNSQATITQTGPKSGFEATTIEITGMAALILLVFILVPGASKSYAIMLLWRIYAVQEQ
jgi:hypothetical protein